MVKLTTLTNHTWTSPSLMQEEELSNEVLSFDIHFLKPDANVAAHLTAKNAIASNIIQYVSGQTSNQTSFLLRVFSTKATLLLNE
jgi:hypothetical protein